MTEGAALTGLQQQLAGLRGDVSGVRGALVASCDGHPIAHNLPVEAADDGGRSAAAMIAALLGIGQRLAELTDDPELVEATVRSAAGSVIVYAVGAHAVMTVLTDESVNLAGLKLAARRRIPTLAESVAALTDPGARASAG